MLLTTEQKAIINSTGDIKINAVAGSGKTTTVIEYAKTRSKNSKILYLAFNKSVKLEAQKKFSENGLNNVDIETAHSLAFKHIVHKHKYKLNSNGYKTHEIVDILRLKGNGEKHTEFILANHVNKFIAFFCNSKAKKVQDLNYLETINDSKAKAFVTSFYNYIEKQTRIFLAMMNSGEIEITHDFYLKKFQLSKPQLHYDYILFDEGQDASATMLDVFFNQNATKVIVGDVHQQIYGWRHAVNSLDRAKFKTYQLTNSFRFNQDIANLAEGVLDYKYILSSINPININGKGSSNNKKVKAILARTNLGLLLKAIEYVSEKKNVDRIYFEGNINSYTYADDGASLYDILNLYNGKKKLIKDKLINQMKNIDELVEYIEKTEDIQMGLMLEIVMEYGNNIPGILKKIKDKHVDNNEKDKAEMIFSTVHRCKGMEYDSVQIVNDFITEERLLKMKNDPNIEIDLAKLNEEINLLYVAITRTKNILYIPESLVPKDFSATAQIHILKSENKDQTLKTNLFSSNKNIQDREKSASNYKLRPVHTDAYAKWTEELDEELTNMFCEGINVKDMARHFGRTKGAIYARIKKLDLHETYGWE